MSDALTKLIRDIEDQKESRRAWAMVPYGAAESQCPNGSIWQKMNEKDKWHEWTNKPWQWEFYRCGKYARERMLCGGNRVGKTILPTVELVYHLTGLYPEWWIGDRFDDPILAWELATSNDKSKNVQQKLLLGPGGAKRPGGGLLPLECIVDISTRQCGIDNVADTVTVRWKAGQTRREKLAHLCYKSYSQGIEAFAGESVPWIRFDEEPDPGNAKHHGVWGECLTRLLDCNGHLVVTYTP